MKGGNTEGTPRLQKEGPCKECRPMRIVIEMEFELNVPGLLKKVSRGERDSPIRSELQNDGAGRE